MRGQNSQVLLEKKVRERKCIGGVRVVASPKGTCEDEMGPLEERESTWEGTCRGGDGHVTKERQWSSMKCTACSAHSLHGSDPYGTLPPPFLSSSITPFLFLLLILFVSFFFSDLYLPISLTLFWFPTHAPFLIHLINFQVTTPCVKWMSSCSYYYIHQNHSTIRYTCYLVKVLWQSCLFVTF